jgi:hypothetical protein
MNMSELDRKRAWDDLVNKLRELRYDDQYKEELAGAIEHYVACLKKDGFPMDNIVIWAGENKFYIISIVDLPSLIKTNLNVLNHLRRVWGGIST